MFCFIVASIAQCGPEAVIAAKQLVFDVTHALNWEAALSSTVQSIAARRASNEGQDGMRAFLEKRKPGWMESSP